MEETLQPIENNEPVPEQTASGEGATVEPAQTDGPLLRVEGLKKYFVVKASLLGKPLKMLRAVDDVSFEVEKGKTIGVVGESGCGKTTLGRTILKLYDPNGGKIYFNGDDITDLKKSQMQKYRTDMQLIFQDPYSSLPPRMTVGSIISEPVRVHNIVPKDQVHSYVLDVMKSCGLQPQYYDRYPHEFSGGQRQRICIARALAVNPKLVICDEPVSALDVSIQAQIINLLKDLQREKGLTYVFISHDLSVVKYITDSILVMYLGNAMELGETNEIFDNPLHPYTKALFSAVPVPNPDVKMKRIILEGDIPSPVNPPSGCKFHTRCVNCMKVCKYKVPEYVEAQPGHFVACHLYNQEIMSDLEKYDAEYDRLEAERLAALEEEKKNKELGFFGRLKKRFKKQSAGDVKPEEQAPTEQPERTALSPADEQKIKPAPVEEHGQPEEEAQAAADAQTPVEEKPIEEKPAEKTVPEKKKSAKGSRAQAVSSDSTADKPEQKSDDKPTEKSDDKPDDKSDDKPEQKSDNKPDDNKPGGAKPGASKGTKPSGAKSTGAKSGGASKGKAKASHYVDDGHTVFSMAGLTGRSDGAGVSLTRKEKRAAIKAAMARFLPTFLGVVGCFTAAAMLMYLWLH